MTEGSEHELKHKIALSCRILAMEGLVEGLLGHVSARVPKSEEMFIRCRGEDDFGLPFTTESDIRRVNFDGKGIDFTDQYEIPKEYPIHGEMYKNHPSVGCVIHAHPPMALLCGISELEFQPIFGAYNIPAMRMALEGIPVFPRSVLINRSELAQQLIDFMGDKSVCLMKGHGITVTGRTVEEATVKAINFNTLAKITWEVTQKGKEVPRISQEDIDGLPDLGNKFNNRWVWRYYVKILDRKGWGIANEEYL
ncbi:class II aldolase/adducin family protein [Aneurinibacillus sp. Ricciae_BoGa-3]|uniref:class II aldolase/adducin family protein n=1 Tax=Aneurinibacillus sp. Ricciae_BoGa-3 TaxID=3022697 RepID=UPI0023415DB0|nr:class II aldolase/adducin family protein [Aneurinibacillus sp. Ricciae_BoGa-3]WCK52328.1 class II aldolase/adducin family protein [Aneurinibacillus sp. Ricciae_BoGa-3]